MTASSQNKTKPLPEIEKEDFHNLVGLVKELKSESLRHLELETEAQTEFEVLNSQLRSNRSAVGKLAEVSVSNSSGTADDIHALSTSSSCLKILRRCSPIGKGKECFRFTLLTSLLTDF